MSKIILEDFNEGDGFYKVNLAYLNKEQVEEIEALVSKWNPTDEDIKSCIGMCLTDANEQRFKDYGTNLRDCLAWLEKQGETYTKKDVDDAYVEGIAFAKSELEKQSKQKPVINIDIPFGTKDSELIEASYYIPEGFHAEIEGNNVVIKKGEQKLTPIDINKMVDDYANTKERGNEKFGLPLNCMIRAYRQGLNDAIEKVALKAAWSKKDMYMIENLIHIFEVNYPNEYYKPLRENISQELIPVVYSIDIINWLKSLKERIGG